MTQALETWTGILRTSYLFREGSKRRPREKRDLHEPCSQNQERSQSSSHMSFCLEDIFKSYTLHKWKGPPDRDGDVVEASGRRKRDPCDRRFPQECPRPENSAELPPAHNRTSMHWGSAGSDRRPRWVTGQHPWYRAEKGNLKDAYLGEN